MVYLTNWSGTVAKWSRLAGVLVSLFADALSGALLLGHAHIYAPVLPFTISVAVVATAATAFGYRDEAHEQ